MIPLVDRVELRKVYVAPAGRVTPSGAGWEETRFTTRHTGLSAATSRHDAYAVNIRLFLTGESLARAIGSVVAGIVTAFAVVLAVETIGLQIFPQPAGMDPLNPESVRQYMAEIPTGSFVVVLVAWTLGAFTGPVVAKRIAGEHARGPAITVVALFVAMIVYNLLAVPGPAWMIPGAVVGVGAASMFGLRSHLLSPRLAT